MHEDSRAEICNVPEFICQRVPLYPPLPATPQGIVQDCSHTFVKGVPVGLLSLKAFNIVTEAYAQWYNVLLA